MILKDSGGDYTPAPAGTHIARCISVINLGTQHSEMYGNDSLRVMLAWELCNETKAIDGKEVPLVVNKEYTASLNKKATLRHHLDAWRGKSFTEEELKGFDTKKILGAPCMLTITHSQNDEGKTRAKINSVTSLLKGTGAPEPYHKLINYEITDGRNDMFKSLPEWIQKKIDNCAEWNQGDATQAEPDPVDAPDEDSVPF